MSTARERTLEAMGKPIPSATKAIKLKVNGEEVVIDPRTLTGTERQKMKRTLSSFGYEPDANDAIYVTIWIVMSRTDPTLTIEEVLDAVTIGDLEDAEMATGADDDSPEASGWRSSSGGQPS